MPYCITYCCDYVHLGTHWWIPFVLPITHSCLLPCAIVLMASIYTLPSKSFWNPASHSFVFWSLRTSIMLIDHPSLSSTSTLPTFCCRHTMLPNCCPSTTPQVFTKVLAPPVLPLFHSQDIPIDLLLREQSASADCVEIEKYPKSQDISTGCNFTWA